MFKSAVIILLLGSVFLLECNAANIKLQPKGPHKVIKPGGVVDISVDDELMKKSLNFLLSERNSGLEVARVISAKRQTTNGYHYIIIFKTTGGQKCKANFTVRGSGDKMKLLSKNRGDILC
uniref:Venom cystatin 7 n=1 Tax=Oncocephalus sp. TaxID=2944721 RepID=A0AB38ZET1_9HEMI